MLVRYCCRLRCRCSQSRSKMRPPGQALRAGMTPCPSARDAPASAVSACCPPAAAAHTTVMLPSVEGWHRHKRSSTPSTAKRAVRKACGANSGSRRSGAALVDASHQGWLDAVSAQLRLHAVAHLLHVSLHQCSSQAMEWRACSRLCWCWELSANTEPIQKERSRGRMASSSPTTSASSLACKYPARWRPR